MVPKMQVLLVPTLAMFPRPKRLTWSGAVGELQDPDTKHSNSTQIPPDRQIRVRNDPREQRKSGVIRHSVRHARSNNEIELISTLSIFQGIPCFILQITAEPKHAQRDRIEQRNERHTGMHADGKGVANTVDAEQSAQLQQDGKFGKEHAWTPHHLYVDNVVQDQRHVRDAHIPHVCGYMCAEGFLEADDHSAEEEEEGEHACVFIGSIN